MEKLESIIAHIQEGEKENPSPESKEENDEKTGSHERKRERKYEDISAGVPGDLRVTESLRVASDNPTADNERRYSHPRNRRGDIKRSRKEKEAVLPERLAECISDLTAKVRPLAWQIASLTWRRFNGAELPKAYVCERWGAKEWEAKRTLSELRAAGIVEVTSLYSTVTHTGNTYNIPPGLRREAAGSQRVFYSYEDYLLQRHKRKRRHSQRQNVHMLNPDLVEPYRSLYYTLDIQAVYDITVTLPEDKRENKWRKICYTPSGAHAPVWVQSEKTWRVNASQPAMQNLPKCYRTPPVFSSPVIYEVDYKAQHANILRAINGLPPLPNVYERIAGEGMLERRVVKQIITASIGGQTVHTWLHSQRARGEEANPETFKRVVRGAQRLGIQAAGFPPPNRPLRELPIDELMQIGSTIMGEIITLLWRWEKLPASTLPLHDGLVIASPTGEAVDVEAVKDAFQQASLKALGFKLPFSYHMES